MAVVEILLKVFGPDIGDGYNIGCKFWTMLDCSELGPHAQELGFKILVGVFYGHPHNHMCQLSFLVTYMSREWDLRIWRVVSSFSQNQMCLLCLSDTSIFHQQQKVIEFMKHTSGKWISYGWYGWSGARLAKLVRILNPSEISQNFKSVRNQSEF